MRWDDFDDYSNNPFVESNILEDQFTAFMKEQERISIQSVLDVSRQLIKTHGDEVAKNSENKSDDLKNFASKTIVSDLDQAYKGKTADSAKDYLTHTLKKPDLKSAIKDSWGE